MLLNYIIRGSIAVLGVLLLTGIIGVDTPEGTTLRIMGAIMIVWGIYRTISFYRSYKKMNISEDDSNEE